MWYVAFGVPQQVICSVFKLTQGFVHCSCLNHRSCTCWVTLRTVFFPIKRSVSHHFRKICAKMNLNPFRCFSKHVGLRSRIWVISALIALYSALPFVLKYSRSLQSMIIYVNFIPLPLGDLSKPEYFGLEGTRHMCLKQYDKTDVCLWHILPAQYKDAREARYSDVFGDGASVIVYAHGNTGSRAVYHRVQLYQQLSSLGYHVVAFDYRGFGDSGGSPSEVGLLEDLELVWNWLLPQVGDAQVFVYGHSLGTAPASKLAAQLSNSSELLSYRCFICLL